MRHRTSWADPPNCQRPPSSGAGGRPWCHHVIGFPQSAVRPQPTVDLPQHDVTVRAHVGHVPYTAPNTAPMRRTRRPRHGHVTSRPAADRLARWPRRRTRVSAEDRKLRSRSPLSARLGEARTVAVTALSPRLRGWPLGLDRTASGHVASVLLVQVRCPPMGTFRSRARLRMTGCRSTGPLFHPTLLTLLPHGVSVQRPTRHLSKSPAQSRRRRCAVRTQVPAHAGLMYSKIGIENWHAAAAVRTLWGGAGGL
jgi:hypothetical protein